MEYLTDCLLICPPRDEAQFYHEYPILGVAYIAGVLIEKGITTNIYDPQIAGYENRDILDVLKKFKPRIIGISIIYNKLPDYLKLIKRIKKHYPQGFLVAGGPQITSNPAIIADMGLQYGFRGDAEFVFASFCNDILQGKKPFPNTKGLVLNNSDALIINPPAFIENLDDIPYPAFHLFDLKGYPHILFSDKPGFTLNTARGCPYNCMFCDKLFQTKHRHNSTAYIINTIKILLNAGVEVIDFVDETFTLKKQRIIELCKAIIDQNLHFEWGCWSRADLLDVELLSLMKEAGLKRILIGVETGNESLRFSIRKKITNKQFLDVVEACTQLNIITECTFILGHHGETIEQMEETIRFTLELNPDYAYFFKLNVVPSSELFEIYKKEQQKDEHLFENFMTDKEAYPFYYPEGIDDAFLNEMVNKAYQTFYGREERQMQYSQSSFLKSKIKF